MRFRLVPMGLFVMGLVALLSEPVRAGHRCGRISACCAPCESSVKTGTPHPSSYTLYLRAGNQWVTVPKIPPGSDHRGLYNAGKARGWIFVNPQHWQAPKSRADAIIFTISPTGTDPSPTPDPSPTTPTYCLYYCVAGSWGTTIDEQTDYDALYQEGLCAQRVWAECSETCLNTEYGGAFTICLKGQTPGTSPTYSHAGALACVPCEPPHRGLFGRLHSRRSGCGPCR